MKGLTNMKFSAIVLGAGSSSRFGESDKIILPVLGRPLIMQSVSLMEKYSDDVIVVANENNIEEIKKYHQNTILGGSSRTESVCLGVKQAKYSHILIHDGARPNLKETDLLNLISCIGKTDLAFLGSPLYDSLKNSEMNDIKRDGLVLVYTPQLVLKEDYLEAYALALKDNVSVTDDVSLIAKMLNKKPEMVLGSPTNTKITTYENYLDYKKQMENDFRIGHAWDIHQKSDGRPLYLGGVLFEGERGLLGHSDADVLLHAISEALLGAFALGDLGKYYPDNSEKTLGMSSKIILKECYDKVLDLGFEIGNIDSTVYLEKPRLAAHIDKMEECVATVLGIAKEKVSIKATTHEKLGLIGEDKAIASEALVLLFKKRK